MSNGNDVTHGDGGAELSATPGSAFEADDRGNVVDFYAPAESGEWERVARLDREAEVNGKSDQLAFDNWAGGPELEAWMKENRYGDELNEAAKL